MNYAYAILETEATIALHAYGFDPGMGILHTDKRYRWSLAYDLMEPVRPVVDGLLLDLVASRAFVRGDFHETREGVCRLGPSLARTLASWAPRLRQPLQGYAGLMAEELLGQSNIRPARTRNAVSAGKGSKRRQSRRPAESLGR
jgi:CRISPR-associated protein Cas1